MKKLTEKYIVLETSDRYWAFLFVLKLALLSITGINLKKTGLFLETFDFNLNPFLHYVSLHLHEIMPVRKFLPDLVKLNSIWFVL